MKRLTLAAVCVVLLLVLLACGGKPPAGNEDGQAPQAKDSPQPAQKDGKPAQKPRREVKIGEPYRSGDLVVTVTQVNGPPISGQYNGRFASLDATMAYLDVKNVNAGKIIEWPGWQGKATLEDEHGNRFAPLRLAGWSWLPGNTPNDARNGDFGGKIHPGKTYSDAVYFEQVPATSKTVTLTGTVDGVTVAFRGPYRP